MSSSDQRDAGGAESTDHVGAADDTGAADDMGGAGDAASELWQKQLAALGGFIRVQRRLSDMSLREMAALTSVSNAYLSQVERGLHQPSLRVLRSIAQALSIAPEELLRRANFMSAADGGYGTAHCGSGRTAGHRGGHQGRSAAHSRSARGAAECVPQLPRLPLTARRPTCAGAEPPGLGPAGLAARRAACIGGGPFAEGSPEEW